MGISVELSVTNLVVATILYFLVKKAFKFYKYWEMQQVLEKWNDTPKGKVILHAVPRGKDLPSISPFCLKLETYLRMAKIQYEFDGVDMFGPKGKSPWISLNGTHMADSSLILQFLNKKFEKDLNKNLTVEQREITRALRLTLEGNFFWGLASWRWVEDVASVGRLMNINLTWKLWMPLRSRIIEQNLKSHGLGMHSYSERHALTVGDLRTVSIILGKKPFIGGDEPCEEDCSIFGFLAQALWAAPNSPYENIIDGELHNLKAYCFRMKERFWSDWDKCLQSN